ncbi:S8 family serine peptidase [Pelagicoccus albus]|uniref:S8 family serine peptidase n=1 Tax=Pelagicoccus albus TaxID=415222 RepID=A0A7X1B9E5_9BACT|nr:S8 family serine peptidase [Pelagicoccus albus]
MKKRTIIWITAGGLCLLAYFLDSDSRPKDHPTENDPAFAATGAKALQLAFPHARLGSDSVPPIEKPLPSDAADAQIGQPVFLGAIGHYESIMALTTSENVGPITRFYAADQIGVRPIGGFELSALEERLSQLGYRFSQPFEESPLLSVHLDPAQSKHIVHHRQRLRETLAEIAVVDFYEVFKNFFGNFDASPVVPDDLLYDLQWNLPAIEAPRAWRFQKGSSDVVVGVIDTGADLEHPDLLGGLVDGKNFAYSEILGIPEEVVDDPYGHGTAMASAIAAATNNRLLLAAVTWRCKVMPLKWKHMTFAPYGAEEAAIEYALARGVRILNYSAGGGPDDLLAEAVREAGRQDCLFVTSMGNYGDDFVSWPAVVDEAVAVGASGKDRKRVYYSCYGDHIDLIAPGDLVPALYPTYGKVNQWWTYSGGTSLAAAQVSAAAAMLLSINPDFTRRDLKLFLYAGCDDMLGDENDTLGWDKYHGWGHLNLYNSVVLATLPTKIEEISGGRGILRWKVPISRRSEVGYQIEMSYDLETWYVVEDPEIRFEEEDAYWEFRGSDSANGPEKSFFRIRPTFSKELLEAASM